jgi:hypothetical protein
MMGILAFRDAAPVLEAGGFEPVPITLPTDRHPHAGKAPATPDWQLGGPVARWLEEHGHRGTGILTRRAPTLDIDISHVEAAEAVHRLAITMLGDAPIRIGRAPRRALVFRTARPFIKVTGRPFRLAGETHKIEVLGDGQQVVCYGKHPGTGLPYAWVDWSLLDLKHEDLPELDEADARNFVAAAEAMLERDFDAVFLPPRGESTPGSEWEADPETGLVVEGREPYLAHLVWEASAESPDPERVGRIAWERFAATADITRPHGKRPWRLRDAVTKARAACRKREKQDDENRPRADLRRVELPPAEKRHEAKEAASLLERAVEGWIAESEAWLVQVPRKGSPPTHGIAATVGIGKTTMVLRKLAKAAKGRTVHVYVPTLALAEEIAAEARMVGMPADVLRGRSANGADGTPLCRKHDIAEALARAGMEVWGSLCERRDERGEVLERCEFFYACPYVRQFDDTGGKLIAMSQEWLHLPKARLADPDLVLIDEKFHASLIRRRGLPLSRLDAPRVESKAVPAEAVADHIDRAAAVRRALEASKPLAESSVTADELKAMGTIEDKLAFASPIFPGQKLEVQRERARRLLEAESYKLAKLWRVAAEDYDREGGSQRIVLRRGIEWHGELQDRVEILYRSAFKPPAAPTLIIDADLDPTITGKVLPLARTTAIPAKLQAEIVQVIDTAVSKRKLVGWTEAPAEELRRAEGRRGQVQVLAAREVAQGRQVLLVATKAVVKSLTLPQGVEAIHFGALRGLDRFKAFDTILVVGREQPPPIDMENQARAWFGDDDAALALPGTYERRKSTIRLADGSGIEVDTWHHADPRVQALLEQVREREIEQAVGRLRLVWRAKPARVFLVTNTPTRLTVDRLVTWDGLMPDRLEQALRRSGGVLPLSASELARVFPDLWADARAVANWLAYGRRKGTETLIVISYWGFSTLSEATVVSYRRPGQTRGSPQRAVLPGRVEDAAAAEAVLAAVVGEVEQVQVVEVLRRPGAAAEAAPPATARRREVPQPPARPRTPPLTGAVPPSSAPPPGRGPPPRPPPDAAGLDGRHDVGG